MGNVTSKFVMTALGAAALIGMGMAAMAQEGGQYYGGVSSRPAGMMPGTTTPCPTTEWHIKPLPAKGPATIVGFAYFSDMSGISKIQGTRTADGKITGTVTSMDGNGPAGSFTGTHTAAATHVELAGAGCSKHVVNIRAMQPNYGASPG
ncbi:MAG: hypothetical protein ABSA58_08190 [Acetobacteraceae bacterium]|jgi:hypothetical protein